MKSIIEIKKEMSIILADVKLPVEIHSIIKEIYINYQDSYKRLIEALKREYPEKEKEILKIEHDTIEDYKEDIQMTQLVEFEEYEQKRTIIIELINSILKEINAKKVIPKQIFKEEMAKYITNKTNTESTNIIINNVISEIESSGKYVLNKINSLRLPRNEVLIRIEDEFKEEFLQIKQRAIAKAPGITEILNKHFVDIYERLDDIIDMYRQEAIAETKVKENYDEER